VNASQYRANLFNPSDIMEADDTIFYVEKRTSANRLLKQTEIDIIQSNHGFGVGSFCRLAAIIIYLTE
jgi:hypothetical protein